METEKQVETYLRLQIKELGGEAYKFVSPGRKFVTDRICVCPEGVLVFVEVKGNGFEPNVAQLREIRRLSEKGHEACWVSSKVEVDKLIKVIKEEINARYRNRKGTPKD